MAVASVIPENGMGRPHGGPLGSRVCGYFFGAGAGVSTLSINELAPPRLLVM
jgi:hypothetical protein